MKRIRLLPCILLGSLATGCISQIRDEFDDTRVAYFNHNLATAAYCEASPLFATVDCPYSFKLGFEAGFIAICNGGNGCPPIFPPGSKIFSKAWLDDGTPDDRRNAWYDGYSHGVLAAHQTGASDINRIPARLPHRQEYDITQAPTAPSEFAPLLPSPSPVQLDGGALGPAPIERVE
jgi:hypothetical protein